MDKPVEVRDEARLGRTEGKIAGMSEIYVPIVIRPYPKRFLWFACMKESHGAGSAPVQVCL